MYIYIHIEKLHSGINFYMKFGQKNHSSLGSQKPKILKDFKRYVNFLEPLSTTCCRNKCEEDNIMYSLPTQTTTTKNMKPFGYCTL